MAQNGSKVIVNLPQVKNDHRMQSNRDALLQHPLQSIYRESDQKSLIDILKELQETNNEFKYEIITVLEDNQTVVNLSTFTFDPTRDVLLVTVQGIDCNAGTDKDYIKTGPAQVTFNRPLKKDYEVFIALVGTINSQGFGNDIYTSISQFRQLADTPNSYYGKGGLFVQVNPQETGLIFSPSVATTTTVKNEYNYRLTANSYVAETVSFIHSGIIKGIRITPEDTYVGLFTFSIWTQEGGYWIYYSGDIQDVLWDIMDIPHIDESGQDSVFIKLENKGTDTNFRVEIFSIL